MTKRIFTIAITGGPCSGKTTAKSWIQNAFEERGYTVLFVPETATESVTAGFSSEAFRNNLDFESCIFGSQKVHEDLFKEMADTVKSNKVLIVCDRGLMDCKAFAKANEFEQILHDYSTNETEIFGRYDAVFHLVTAANGAEKAYTLANNTVRVESPQQAREIDEQLIQAWVGHSHWRCIDNSTNFKGKMHRLITEIASFLGEPKPYEIERKFLIEMPNLESLKRLPYCRKVEIIQTYLKSNKDEEIRVRQRGENGHYVFYFTKKMRISSTTREEIERRLTQEEYLSLLMAADTKKHQIRKDRYCLRYGTEYLEIDIFPFDNQFAILEIELNDENQKIRLPEWINVIKEVTGNHYYDNSTLAITQKL